MYRERERYIYIERERGRQMEYPRSELLEVGHLLGWRGASGAFLLLDACIYIYIYIYIYIAYYIMYCIYVY